MGHSTLVRGVSRRVMRRQLSVVPLLSLSPSSRCTDTLLELEWFIFIDLL